MPIAGSKLLHSRMEWFLHWFIDGISEIDQDERWHVYVAYKRPLTSPGGVDYPSHSRKLRPRASSGRPGCLSLCGFATTYTFWSLPSSRRRLSQFLIFPHYQRKGVGTDLLEMIYKQALDDPKVKQIGVERPAPAFVQLRDVVTVKLAIDRNLVSPLALYPPPPGAEVPSSASAAFPASSGLGLTNGLPLDKTRGRTHKLHSALFDAGASGAASSAAAAASASTASGGMSIGSKKRRLSAAPGGTTLQSKKRRLSWGG
uniref:Histone acetyltransferase n=1 Tax=Vitrella brassicaformis TaxID=1169539 RepID=A0A7S1KHK4_9ALVE